MQSIAPIFLLADDHELCRIAVKNYLLGLKLAGTVIEAKNGHEVLEILNLRKVDLLILDMKMPELNGFEAAELALKKHPGLKILVVTMFNEPALIMNFIDIGISGYMLKSDSDLDWAVRTVMAGQFYYSKELEPTIKRAQFAVDKPVPVTLTHKEKKILPLIAQGKSSEEMAELLSLKKNTIESYRKDLIEKFKVSNSSELVDYAHRTGLL
jgi:DNA-binding NarL/FixJ family response regulator